VGAEERKIELEGMAKIEVQVGSLAALIELRERKEMWR